MWVYYVLVHLFLNNMHNLMLFLWHYKNTGCFFFTFVWFGLQMTQTTLKNFDFTYLLLLKLLLTYYLQHLTFLLCRIQKSTLNLAVNAARYIKHCIIISNICIMSISNKLFKNCTLLMRHRLCVYKIYMSRTTAG